MDAAYEARRRQQFLDRATAKSDEQARAGNLPRVVRHNAYERIWAVASRTEGGVWYLITETKAGELGCDCPATLYCWHKVHVSRALEGSIGRLERAVLPPVAIPAAYFSGRVS